ncbi:MAG TPA: hypothetical protein VMO26_14240 [Vicinamibacterales bacterium]|nr:hypothetical protein [Vicinamibacterales bacterium]
MTETDLPSRIFVFMEAYCAEPRCDCRRVMLNVIDAETHDHVATINYAFEAPKPPFDDEGQLFLDPLNPQTARPPAFLELTADMIAHDRAYHDIVEPLTSAVTLPGPRCRSTTAPLRT